jgi:hypothetical protein
MTNWKNFSEGTVLMNHVFSFSNGGIFPTTNSYDATLFIYSS